MNLDKEEQSRPKQLEAKIKIRAEISKIENRKAQHKINKTKSQFFEEINKIDKSLTGKKKKYKKETILMRGTVSIVYTDNKDLSF